jgi:hypothetical protein
MKIAFVLILSLIILAESGSAFNRKELLEPLKLAREDAKKHPNVGSSLAAALFVDFWNFIKSPSSGTFITFFGDFSIFYVIPFVGGYLRAEAYMQYSTDSVTFDNAEITEDEIYT